MKIDFATTTTVTPPAFDIHDFSETIMDWWMAGLGGVMHVPIATEARGRIFPGWPGYAHGFDLPTTRDLNQADDCLPSFYGVVIRRITNIRGRAGLSKIHVPGVRYSEIERDMLTLPAYSVWQNAAGHFRSPFTYLGVTFRQVVPYYSLANFRQPTAVQVNRRLGVMNRRKKAQYGGLPMYGRIDFP